MIAAGNCMSGNTVELRPSDRRQLKVAATTEKDDIPQINQTDHILSM